MVHMRTNNSSYKNQNQAGHSATNPLSDIPGLSDWLTVVSTYQACEKLMSKQLANIGLTLAQYDVFASLLVKDGQTQQEIAERNLVVKSNISGIVKRMQANGWVMREPDRNDARKNQVLLTKTGRQLALKGVAIQSAVVKLMCDAITSKESSQLAGISRKMRDALLSADN